MTADGENGGEARLAALLRDFLRSKTFPDELSAELSGIEGLKELHADLAALRKALLAISGGDLSGPLDARGFLPGVVKDLQAGLKHLTWQTQRIARGDFTQRVDFLGEFSEAFNAMVAHLSMSVKTLRESEERFRLLSITDPLTGLYNRRHFFEAAGMEIERAERYESCPSLCLFDIDAFKLVNDEHGHLAGDSALKMIAETSVKSARRIDIVARYGGEEFAAVFPHTGLPEARIVAERMRRAVEAARLDCPSGVIRVTASFGVAGYDSGGAAGKTSAESLQELLRQADEALYRAKDSGRNRVVVAG